MTKKIDQRVPEVVVHPFFPAGRSSNEDLAEIRKKQNALLH